MMKKNKFLLFAGLLFLFFNTKAQDPHFTQFYANPLYLNPAFAGAYKCPKFTLNYRNQWPGIPTPTGGSAFATYSASYDQSVDALGGGLGMLVMSDQAGGGILTTLEVSAIYSYHLTISREFSLLVGFQGTYRQRSLDKAQLTFGDQIDPALGFVYTTQEQLNQWADVVRYPDFSAGFLGFGEKFYFGGAFHHITTPDDSYLLTTTANSSSLPMKITLHAGATLPIGGSRSGTSLSPGLLFQTQGGFTQLNYLFSITANNLVGGLSIRHSFQNADAVTVLLGYQLDKLRMGYSYDYTINGLGGSSGGAHEVSIAYQLNCKPKKKKFKTINCPKF